MPRSIELSAAPEKIDAILQRLKEVEGVVSLARLPGASLTPPGDVLSIHATNEASRPVLAILDELEVAKEGSIRTSAPTSLMSRSNQAALDRETNETFWDEMAFMLRGDTNPSPNYLTTMALAGAIAAGGLWTNTLHLVIAAMLIAPGFEPLVRLPFGFIAGSRQLVPSGLTSVGAGYLMLAAGAALATLILGLWGPAPSTTLADQQWVRYWSTLSFSNVLVSAFGGIAGAMVIGGQRAVLTTGVMVTLALIPSMALVGMGIVVADTSLMGKGFVRWAVDVALVIIMSSVVFGLKQRSLQRHRRAMS